MAWASEEYRDLAEGDLDASSNDTQCSAFTGGTFRDEHVTDKV
jgi:hypothetical protein